MHTRNNAMEVDADGTEPMDVEEEGVPHGPLTEADDALEEIHTRRERALATIRDRLRGTQEEIWALEDQENWWLNVI